MRSELEERAARAVQLAKDCGADDCLAAVAWGRSVELGWHANAVEKVQESDSLELSVRLFAGGRYSAHSTNDLDEGRLKRFLTDAVALTRALEPDPFREIAARELFAGLRSVELDQVDASLTSLDRDRRMAIAGELATAAEADDAVIGSNCMVFDSAGAAALVGSNGFRASRESTSLWYGAEVSMRDGERRPEAHRYVGDTHAADLPSPSETGAEALRRVKARIGARKVSSRRGRMILTPEAGTSFLGRLLGAISASAVQQKRTFLADAQGQRIASPLLTMTDDPFRKRSSASRTYDGDGVALAERRIVSEGVLETFYIDSYYGKKLGWKPNGGCTTNLVFGHGDQDLAGLLGGIDQGICVESWLGGNADMTSGGFSFGFAGHLVEHGELTEPVTEMNITGNYKDLLQQLVAVGNDPLPWSTFRTPTLVFDGVDFAGT
ncbi:TldD/PmbA family protein [Engelhardtia mirabilis]|uniref:Peptidase PmbA n=1 Tax=Engelhardtia mirabilis TaxID=2528011 RepID=A0A518BG39_9BACT|nr:peptidase PmbA [Planctomycetes bacterium Pla133]QDV00252.1 peptidase PmbA [Planctomycetes bacterium Pla86]